MVGRNRALIATVVLLGVGLTGFVAYRIAVPPVTLYREIPTQIFNLQPELKTAYKNYVAQGNEYIWGANDCSRFVADYIASCGTPSPFRPTTVELMKADFMDKVGFARIDGKIEPGDILVFRYRNEDKEWRGHTGIVVWHEGRQWVMHNTARYDGVVVESLAEFDKRAKSLTGSDANLFRIWRRKDFDSWYTGFSAKRDQT